MTRTPTRLRRARRPLSLLAIGTIALAAASGCSAPKDNATMGAANKAAAPEVAGAPAAGGSGVVAADTASANGQSASAINAIDASPAANGRKVVSSATLTVETDDLTAGKEKAAQLVRAAGGEVYQETSSFGVRGSSVLTLKMPPEKFDEVLKQLGELGKLSKQEIKTEDVTQQVIDLDARIRSSEASVNSVQGFVSESKNLIETAQLENELQRRISELESLRAQRQNLEKRIDLSTIVLTLESDKGTPVAEEAKAPPPAKPPLGFGDGLDGGLTVATDILRAIAVAAGAFLPFSPLAIFLVLAIRWRRRTRPERPARPSSPPPMPPFTTGPTGPTGPAGTSVPSGPVAWSGS